MTGPGRRLAICACALLAAGAALAAPPPPAAAARKPAAPSSVPLLPGGGSKEPVNISADKLDYFDKDQKLIYTGGVVAVQGDSTLKASVLTIFLQKQDAAPQTGAAPQSAAAAPMANSSVKRMVADGPVTLISKDQVGTGDGATYDKDANKVTLTGHVTLSQGSNVTQGERLVYDMTSGQAQMFSGTGTDRVTSVFTPGSGAPGGTPGGAAPSGAKPAPKRDKAAGAANAGAGKKAASSGGAAAAEP